MDLPEVGSLKDWEKLFGKRQRRIGTKRYWSIWTAKKTGLPSHPKNLRSLNLKNIREIVIQCNRDLCNFLYHFYYSGLISVVKTKYLISKKIKKNVYS